MFTLMSFDHLNLQPYILSRIGKRFIVHLNILWEYVRFFMVYIIGSSAEEHCGAGIIFKPFLLREVLKLQQASLILASMTILYAQRYQKNLQLVNYLDRTGFRTQFSSAYFTAAHSLSELRKSSNVTVSFLWKNILLFIRKLYRNVSPLLHLDLNPNQNEKQLFLELSPHNEKISFNRKRDLRRKTPTPKRQPGKAT